MRSSSPIPSVGAARRTAPGAGWGLALARTTWVAVALLTLGLFLAAVPLRFAQLQNICAGVACSEMQLSFDDVRVLQAIGLSPAAYAAYNLALEIVFVAVHVGVAVTIFARRSDDFNALFVSLMLITFGAAAFAGTMNALAPRPWAWRLPLGIVSPLPDLLPGWLSAPPTPWRFPVALVSVIGQVTAALFFYLFPSGRFVPRWTVILAAIWVGWQVPVFFFPDSPLNTENWPPLLAVAAWGAFLASCVFAQFYRFRRVSDAAQRQQTKWVVYGVLVALGGFLAAAVLSGVFSYLGLNDLRYRSAVNAAIYLAMLALPISIGIAITRARLWDIGTLVNRTLVYGLLSGMLAVFYAGTIIVLQLFAQPWFGPGRDETLVAISTLGAAALFSPLKQRAQNLIDRRFFRSKYNAAHTLARFSAQMRNEVDLERLSDDLMGVVEQTMQPAHLSLWLRKAPHNESGE